MPLSKATQKEWSPGSRRSMEWQEKSSTWVIHQPVLFHVWSELESSNRSVLRAGGFQLALNQMKLARAQRAKVLRLIVGDELTQRFRQARAFESSQCEMR